jgi:hypothetical protein
VLTNILHAVLIVYCCNVTNRVMLQKEEEEEEEEEELHRQDQGEQPQVARILKQKHKRSKNTDYIIALRKGQARYQSTQQANRQESYCEQEHASEPYNTLETHNNLRHSAVQHTRK